MKTTRYFEEQVLRKRPYIRREWCTDVLAAPLQKETQADGRMRFKKRQAVLKIHLERVFPCKIMHGGEVNHLGRAKRFLQA